MLTMNLENVKECLVKWGVAFDNIVWTTFTNAMETDFFKLNRHGNAWQADVNTNTIFKMLKDQNVASEWREKKMKMKSEESLPAWP